MDRIVIEGVPPYDGRYPFDVFEDGTGLQGYELSWIKRYAGYLVVDIDKKAFGDHELVQVFAVVAMCRAGKITEQEAPTVFDRLQHAAYDGMISLELADREPDADADAGPPSSRSSGNGASSGDGSTTSSETSPETPVSGGTPASAISESTPATWGG